MSAPARPSRLSIKKKLLFSSFTFLTFLAIYYLGSVLHRSYQLYTTLASRADLWDGAIHQADDLLGFSPVPDSIGAMFNQGVAIETRYDKDGFRVPIDFEPPKGYQEKRPRVMAIGCSFTFGDACDAEQTFPFLVARQLDGRVMNAGVCSYGLTQMMLRAEQIVPKHQPDYLLVQFSPWLIDRAQRAFASSNSATLPIPFFCEQDGEVVVHRAFYPTQAFDLKSKYFNKLPFGMNNYRRFVTQVGWRYHMREDWERLKIRLGQFTGSTPHPARDRAAIVRIVYGRIHELARQHGSRMFIVVLGRGGAEHVRFPPESLPIGVPVINVHEAMLRRLEHIDMPNYKLAYWNVDGWPHDEHPNPQAHQIIAQEIVKAIRSSDELPGG